MTLYARDLMQTDPIAVSPEQPLLQAHRLMLEEEIHGAPVVDEDGNVLGVISALDLLRAVQQEYESGAAVPTYFRGDLPYSGPDWFQTPEDFQDRLADLTVGDVMVTEIVSVRPDAPIADVARIMRSQRIHRVLVVDDRQLLGLVTTFDLIATLTEQPPAEPPPRKRRGHHGAHPHGG